MPDPESDDRLVADCLSLAPGAWDRFLARFAGLFRHVARRVSTAATGRGGAEDLDDAVAEIVLEVLRNDAAVLRFYAGRSGLASYLAVIARRVVLRRLMRPRATPSSPGGEPADGHDEFAVILNRDQIAGLLSRLGEADARLVRLHHLESRSYGEISRVTGIPLGSIGPALSRARRLMREVVEAAGGPDGVSESARRGSAPGGGDAATSRQQAG
jgi:RNA polymerase sigma-70 factor (ECF subfamily)